MFRKISAACTQVAVYSASSAGAAVLLHEKISTFTFGFAMVGGLLGAAYTYAFPELRRFSTPCLQVAAAAGGLAFYTAAEHTRLGAAPLLGVAASATAVGVGAWAAGKLLSRRENAQQIG